MATLTWKNVTGSKLDTGADSLASAGSLFSKAFENFSGAVEGRTKRVTKENTDTILNELRGITSQEDFDAQKGNFDLDAISQRLGGDVDTTAISKALASKVPELRNEETRLRNELIGQIPNQILDSNQPGSEGALDYKGQSNAVRKAVRDAGGSSTQGEAAVASLQTVLKERSSLSPDAQIAVAQNAEQQKILTEQASQQLTATRDSILASNPVSHTQDAKGNAITIESVYDKARTEYPSTTSIPWGGSGGDTLTGIMRDLQLNGITDNGSIGIKVGDKYKEGTEQVEPWMLSMAMDLNGQTKADAWGNPTVAKGFMDTVRRLAFNPKYKIMAARAAKANRDHDAGQTQLKLNRLKQGAQFSKDVKSSENARLIQQLQGAVR